MATHPDAFRRTSTTAVSRPHVISDEPIINAVHRHVREILVAFYVLLLIYCSLLPFDFSPIADLYRSPVSRYPQWLGLNLGPARLLDILVNMALYLLLGAGLMRIQLLRRGRWLRAAVATMFVGVGLSLMIELLQKQTISRNASWVDLTSNTLGAALGALLAAVFGPQFRRFARDLQHAAERNWWLAVAKVMVSLMLVAQLRPFDLVLDLRRTAVDAWQHGDFHPLARWNALPTELRRVERIGRARMSDLPRLRWDYALDRAVDVALYAGLAAVLMVGLWRQGRRAWTRWPIAALTVATLACVIVAVRVVLYSYGLDTAPLVCAALAIPIGGLIGEGAIVAMRRERRDAHGTPTPYVWPWAVQEFVPLGVIALVAAYGLAPFDFSLSKSFSGELASQVHWLPMARHYRSMPNIYFMSASGDLIRFGCLAAALSFLTRPRQPSHWRRHLTLIVLTTATIAALIEILHALMPGRTVDVTHVVLSVFGATGGTVALRWASDYRHHVQHCMANDMLTSQLIDGVTYESGGFKRPRWLRNAASRKDRR